MFWYWLHPNENGLRSEFTNWKSNRTSFCTILDFSEHPNDSQITKKKTAAEGCLHRAHSDFWRTHVEKLGFQKKSIGFVNSRKTNAGRCRQKKYVTILGSAAEAKPVNSPHPFRGAGRDGIVVEFLQSFQDRWATPPPPTPSQKHHKIEEKTRLQKNTFFS